MVVGIVSSGAHSRTAASCQGLHRGHSASLFTPEKSDPDYGGRSPRPPVPSWSCNQLVSARRIPEYQLVTPTASGQRGTSSTWSEEGVRRRLQGQPAHRTMAAPAAKRAGNPPQEQPRKGYSPAGRDADNPLFADPKPSAGTRPGTPGRISLRSRRRVSTHPRPRPRERCRGRQGTRDERGGKERATGTGRNAKHRDAAEKRGVTLRSPHLGHPGQ